MPNFSQARDAISTATFALWRVHHDAAPAKKKKVMALIHNLNREYYKLLELNPNLEDQTYEAITAEFRNSTTLINGIREDAENITHNAANLASLLNALAAVGALLA